MNEVIKGIIEEILNRAREVKKSPENEFKDGQMLAYNEVLSILKTDLTPYGAEALGLDIDLDKELL